MCPEKKNKSHGRQFVYHLGGYAACQVMVDNGDSILGEVDIKLDIGCTLQEYVRDSDIEVKL